MSQTFPFGFPQPTAFYLALYVLTLVIHVVFMNYVLAGSAYLAYALLFGRMKNNPLADVLRDWLPFAVSAAITAGVAPLLFVQILYQREFYTANLLLFHRWMAIVPVLIVAFYLAYLLKSRAIEGWPLAGRAAVGCGALACFAFTAWSWTENHLLSLDSESWPAQYAAANVLYTSSAMPSRLALWFFGSFPTLSVCLGWQLWKLDRPGHESQTPGARRITSLALAGLFLSVAAAAAVWIALDYAERAAVTGPLARWYAAAATVGVVAQVGVWVAASLNRRLTWGLLSLASLACLVTLVGGAVVREAVRLTHVDVTALAAQHADAAAVGGLRVFLAFFGLNALLAGYCIRLAGRRLEGANKQ